MERDDPGSRTAVSADGPPVDVGIPTRGDPRYLHEAVESVLRQTHGAWRLTISENGAPSQAVGRALRPYLDDERIRHVATGADLTQAQNFNRLLSAGNAPYVAILHDDDRWLPTFLERRVAFLERHARCGFVFSGDVIIDESGAAVGRRVPPLGEGVHEPADVLPRLLAENPVGVATVLVRRAAYEAVGEYSDRVAYVDHEMWIRLAAFAPIGVAEAFDAEYRVHGRQISSEQRLRAGERRLEVLDAVYRSLHAPPPMLRRARAEALLHSALDAAEDGRRRRAAALVARAVVQDPAALACPPLALRAAGALAAGAIGGPLRSALTRARIERWLAHGAR